MKNNTNTQSDVEGLWKALISMQKAMLANNKSLLGFQTLIVTHFVALQLVHIKLADIKLQQFKNYQKYNTIRRRRFSKNKKRFVK